MLDEVMTPEDRAQVPLYANYLAALHTAYCHHLFSVLVDMLRKM